jgi:hypothetical protein
VREREIEKKEEERGRETHRRLIERLGVNAKALLAVAYSAPLVSLWPFRDQIERLKEGEEEQRLTD